MTIIGGVEGAYLGGGAGYAPAGSTGYASATGTSASSSTPSSSSNGQTGITVYQPVSMIGDIYPLQGQPIGTEYTSSSGKTFIQYTPTAQAQLGYPSTPVEQQGTSPTTVTYNGMTMPSATSAAPQPAGSYINPFMQTSFAGGTQYLPVVSQTTAQDAITTPSETAQPPEENLFGEVAFGTGGAEYILTTKTPETENENNILVNSVKQPTFGGRTGAGTITGTEISTPYGEATISPSAGGLTGFSICKSIRSENYWLISNNVSTSRHYAELDRLPSLH